MNRRFFLAASMGSVALGAPVGAGAGTTHALGDAAEIGRAVLRAGAVEADERALRQALRIGAAESLELGGSWRDAIRRDFAAGETVHVEGWVLSRTEARLCALAWFCLPAA